MSAANPDPTPLVYVAPPVVDPYTPGAEVAAVADAGSGSLLDQVRAFSSAVKRAVRITGIDSIEMVDPAAPLPATWSNADAPHLYAATTHGAASTLTPLGTRAARVSLAAGAQMVTDDARLIPTSWRIPDRLPVYGLPSALVKRVTYTLSPTGFSAALDFYFRDIPIEAEG